MLEDVIQYSKDSWGLIPLMVVVFIIGIAVIIERCFFFRKCIKRGQNLDLDLKRVAQDNPDDIKKVADHYSESAQGQLVMAALESQGKSEEALERDIDETIMVQIPRLDRNLWILDTCVTLGPLLGLLGTIIHMIQVLTLRTRRLSSTKFASARTGFFYGWPWSPNPFVMASRTRIVSTI